MNSACLSIAVLFSLLACSPSIQPLPAPSGSPRASEASSRPDSLIPIQETRSDGRICAAPDVIASQAVLKYPIDLAVSPDGKDIYIVSKRCGEPENQKPVLNLYTFPDCGAELDKNKPVPRSYIYHWRPDQPLEVLKIAGETPLSCELGEDIEIDSQGRLYVTTPHNHRIYRIDPKQHKLEQIVEARQKQLLPTDSDPADTPMTGPMSLVVHRDRVYFRLEAADPNPKPLKTSKESHLALVDPGQKYTTLSVFPDLPNFGKATFTYALADVETNTPEGFETRLYLYEAERLWRVSPFPSALKPSQTLGVYIWFFNPLHPDGLLSNPPVANLVSNRLGDIKVDQKLNVYASHPELNRVLTLDSLHSDFLQNHLEKYAGSTQAGLKDGVGDEAQFRRPAGLALDAERNIYVADMGNHAIRKIAPDRSVSTLYLADNPAVPTLALPSTSK